MQMLTVDEMSLAALKANRLLQVERTCIPVYAVKEGGGGGGGGGDKLAELQTDR